MDLNVETLLREAGKSHRLPGEREKWAEIKKSRAVSAMMIRGQCNWRLLGRSLPSALLSAATTKFSPSFFACWNWLTLPLVGNLDRELRIRQPQLLSVRIIPQSPTGSTNVLKSFPLLRSTPFFAYRLPGGAIHGR